MINSIVGGGIVEVPLSFYNLGVAGGKNKTNSRHRDECAGCDRRSLLDLAASSKQEYLRQIVRLS